MPFGLTTRRSLQGTCQVACGDCVPHGTTILILSAIPPMVLAIFNAPVLASQLQQRLRSRLLRSEGGHRKSVLVGFFADFASAHMLDVAMDANDLGYAR